MTELFGDCDYSDEYFHPNCIHQQELSNALNSLTFFRTDLNLVGQATNLTIVDEFIMSLEYDYLKNKINETSSPYESIFLAAQSQMWIFAAYEVIRTWIQKAKGYLNTGKNSGLHQKLQNLKRDRGYINYTAVQRADEVQALIDQPALLKALEDDIARIAFLFIRLETLRIVLAKHEVRKRPNAMISGFNVGYMNKECGSLEYEINSGMVTLGNISRRNIADDIRAIPTLTVPTEDDVKSYEKLMRGMSDDEAMEIFKSFEKT